MKKNYKIQRPKTLLPVRTLVTIPYEGKDFTFAFPAFGPDYFSNNIQKMKEKYSHPETGEAISFRQPTTPESIAVASFAFQHNNEEFASVKRDIFDPLWLQLGYLVKTNDGVYINPTLNEKGIASTNKFELKKLRERSEKVNDIYLGKNNFAFAPYESFKTGEQSHQEFLEGGLARALEGTPNKKAENLAHIASSQCYKHGVYVYGFDPVSKPMLRVASMGSDRDVDEDRLGVSGDWNNDSYVFGVFDVSGEAHT